METSAIDPAPVEDQYRTLVELAPDVIYRLDIQGRFLALSPAFARITGWPPDQWLGRPFAGIVHPDDLPLAQAHFWETLNGTRQEPFELRVLAADGSVLVGEFTVLPLYEGDRISGSIGVARDITARKQTELELQAVREELQRSRDQLDAILQNVGDGIMVQDRNGMLTYANDAAARILGFRSAEELVSTTGNEMWRRFAVFDAEGHLLPAERLPGRLVHAGQGASEMVVSFHDLLSAEMRWALVKATPVHDETGAVALAVIVFQDITDRRRADEARRQIASIVDSTSDAVVAIDLEARITTWNASATELYGYSPEEVIGRSVGILIPQDRAEELPAKMAHIRRGERIENLETVRLARDGTPIDVSISVSPMFDPDGRIIGGSIIARDIREWKQREAERGLLLRNAQEAREGAEAAQARLVSLARASEILSSSLDYDTTLTNVANLAVPHISDWCAIDVREEDGSIRRIALTHADPEKIRMANELERLYPPEQMDRGLVWQTGQAQLISEIPDEMLVQAARDEEHLRLIRALGLTSGMGVPLIARDRVIGVMSFLNAESGKRLGPEDLSLAEDLARRAAVAVDNARLYRQAQAALALREEFLSIASHELKTPLTALQLQMQLLERALDNERVMLEREKLKRLAGGARRQMRRLGRLIDDLLDVSRLAAGRMEPDREPVDLRRVAEEAIARFDIEGANAPSIMLDAPEPVIALVDRFQFDQMLTNLLSNAVKYGQGQPVDVRIDRVDGQARVRVIDRGIGIPEHHLSRVFDRFERVAISRSYGGLGLGLYITRQLADLNGGTIEAQSEPEAGSTFTLLLPLAP